jgi:hypothetical protein
VLVVTFVPFSHVLGDVRPAREYSRSEHVMQDAERNHDRHGDKPDDEPSEWVWLTWFEERNVGQAKE